MYNYILNSVRLITLEIAKLEGLSKQMKKTHDCERNRQYEEFLTWCKKEREDLLSKHCPESIIDGLKFCEDDDKDYDEKTMAKLFYIEGKSWKEAYYETEEFLDFDDDEYDDKKILEIIKKKCETHQRNIERKVNVFYAFNKKSSCPKGTTSV